MRSPGRLQVKKWQDITALYNFLHSMWSILSPKYTHPLGAGMHWVRDNTTQNRWIHSFLQPLKPKWSMDGGLVRAHEATLAAASPPHHSQILSWTEGQSRHKQFPHFAHHTLRQNTDEEKSKHPFCGLPLDCTDYKETEQASRPSHILHPLVLQLSVALLPTYHPSLGHTGLEHKISNHQIQ